MYRLAALCSVAVLLLVVVAAPAAADTEDRPVKLWCTGGMVYVKVLKSSAKYTDLLNLYDVNQKEVQSFMRNTDDGQTVQFRCAVRTLLKFGIRVLDNNNTFVMGTAADNFDSFVHAKLMTSASNNFTFGFEDLKKTDTEPANILKDLKSAIKKKDRKYVDLETLKDFNDYVVQITGAVSTAYPGDKTAPEITIDGLDADGSITRSTSGASLAVWWGTSAYDGVDGDVDVTCNPKPNTAFRVGSSTTVVCTASDSSNNKGTKKFTVRINRSAKRRMRLV